MRNRRNTIVCIGLFAVMLLGCRPASGAVTIAETGTWPKDWPAALEPFRGQAKTFGIATGIQENVYEIRFGTRDQFERIWPTILQLKSKGAPLRLQSIEGHGGKTGGLFATDLPVARIYTPAYGSTTRKPGGKDLWVGPPWPESIKSPEGLLPEYVTASEDGMTWIPATGGEIKGFKNRARVEIELVVDANVIDLNRIRLPADTPIIDNRKASTNPPASETCTRWISQCLGELQTIRPGDTRAKLLQVCKTEGGISSRQQRRYVWNACPLIKVDVQLRPVSEGAKESDADVITSISKPFLEASIMD